MSSTKSFRVSFMLDLKGMESTSDVTAWIERAIEQQLERHETLHPVIVKLFDAGIGNTPLKLL